VFEKQKVFDVIVKGTPNTRRDAASVRNLLIDKPDGGHVRLGDVATVRIAQTPAVIKRDAVSRYLDVEADVSGRSVSSTANEIEERLANVSLPLEYHSEVLEETTGAEINSTQMLLFGMAAAVAMFLLLQAAFRSWRLAALVFLTVPVALVGGVAGVLIDGAELSLGSLAGLLALFAIAVRNGVLLVRRFQDLGREGEAAGPDLVRRGVQERLAPILASIAAIAVVTLPFIVMGSVPGLEVVHSMAIVLLCGLVTTTAVSLFVLPALYVRFAPAGEPEVSPEEELMYRWAGVEPRPATTGAGAVPVRPAATDGAEQGEGEPGERQPAV
jgi:Cu/Ag efflux pump CusA